MPPTEMLPLAERMRPAERDALNALLPTMHESVVAFARTHFAQEGAGVVVIALPARMPAVPTVASMRYHSLHQVREVMTDAVGVTLAEAETILNMLKTYRPEHEAVVAISYGDHLPLIMTLRFEP